MLKKGQHRVCYHTNKTNSLISCSRCGYKRELNLLYAGLPKRHKKCGFSKQKVSEKSKKTWYKHALNEEVHHH